MAIFNNKGQLFGKVNIIDLLIIIVIISVIGGGIYKFTTLDNLLSEGELKELSLTMEIPSERDGLFESIQKGDIIYDSIRGSEFGIVESKSRKAHKELIVNQEGFVEYTEIPGLYDIEIQVKSPSKVTDDGIVIGTTPIYIGSSIRIRSSLYVFTGDVLNIRDF